MKRVLYIALTGCLLLSGGRASDMKSDPDEDRVKFFTAVGKHIIKTGQAADEARKGRQAWLDEQYRKERISFDIGLLSTTAFGLSIYYRRPILAKIREWKPPFSMTRRQFWAVSGLTYLVASCAIDLGYRVASGNIYDKRVGKRH